jgi:hypothetical protein
MITILGAMTLRDGGTTCVTIDDGGQVKHVTFDRVLGTEGRPRHVYVSDR